LEAAQMPKMSLRSLLARTVSSAAFMVESAAWLLQIVRNNLLHMLEKNRLELAWNSRRRVNCRPALTPETLAIAVMIASA